MFIIQLLSILAVFSAVQVHLADAAPTCHDYVIFSTRGTDEPQGPSMRFGPMIKHVLSTVPGGAEVDTVYPALYDGDSPFLGEMTLRRNIKNALKACPNQKIAILGYSQGAYATSLALQHWNETSNPVFEATKAIVFLGNPVHTPGRDGNVDPSGGKATFRSQGKILSPLTPGLPESFYTSGKVLDVCIPGDFVCDSQSPFQNVHGTYGFVDSIQKMGGDFLVQHLSGKA
ncbi:unnamed protein product [Tilletia controversa]|uniref:Cutinase n=2 Tax=Tilletia TaxID=13289 RepID=A0A8X7MXE6_9BASI|nr:hypothetical protein CF335_g5938 [Tilletia laevis]KAE8201993.1 hypothetical protein CF328_g2476 [Tilletia controversa]KAE8253596.1 hypothetical protein A4X03_0g5854 [Tilletia caries]KAE8196921.1 hypothetical protein CF336_g2401 [Tilletia laevis]KAE8251777.1 hypothetical protein A4X06_0g2536 [Tilletia controversa]